MYQRNYALALNPELWPKKSGAHMETEKIFSQANIVKPF